MCVCVCAYFTSSWNVKLIAEKEAYFNIYHVFLT